jgi:hypothetical protein
MCFSCVSRVKSRIILRNVVLGFGMFATGCSHSSAPAPGEAQTEAPQTAGVVTDTKLSTFAGQIDTTMKSLTLKPGEATTIPVTLRNSGTDPWSSSGKAPITFSYRVLVGSEDKAVETPRTLLPRPLLPDQAVSLDAKIVAPAVPGRYTLRLSMVQEGITWFVNAGGAGTDVRVDVK